MARSGPVISIDYPKTSELHPERIATLARACAVLLAALGPTANYVETVKVRADTLVDVRDLAAEIEVVVSISLIPNLPPYTTSAKRYIKATPARFVEAAKSQLLLEMSEMMKRCVTDTSWARKRPPELYADLQKRVAELVLV